MNIEIEKEALPRLLRADQLAALIGVSKKRVQNLLSRHLIPGAVKVPALGWRIRYDIYLANLEEKPKEPGR